VAEYSAVSWGSDTGISMPEPLPTSRVAYVDMGGFTFTLRGLAHDFNEADRETYLIPMFAPEPLGMSGEVPQ
jgi:hypothetical protein